MAGFGSQIYDVGPKPGQPTFGTPVNADPTREYVTTGPGRLTPTIPFSLMSEFDDVTRNFGFRVLEAMLTDPAVSSSYLSLKLSILAGPLQVQPAIRPKGYREGKPMQVDAGKGKLSGKEKLSVEIAEFCKRDMKRPRKSIKSTINQMLDKMAFGSRLTEKTRQEVKFGPDKGKLGLASLEVKPFWAYKLVVDATMKPKYVLTWIPPGLGGKLDQGGYALISIDKFILSTWLTRDEDPRGTSCLRAAYDWWNLKRQCMPFYYQHLRRFGSPSLDGMVSSTDVADRFPIDPATGLEVTSLPKVGPLQRYTQALIAFQNNSVIVRPAGSELNVLEPKSNGESFLMAFDMFDRAISLAIGMQTRAALEAKHGSKADSETAQDNRSLVTDYAKEETGEEFDRQVFYESVKLNWGEDIAEELTPCLNVGRTEQQDKATMWSAAASIGFKIGPSQQPEMDVDLDLPERDEEADAKAAQDAMQQQADLAAKMKPPGGAAGTKPGQKPAKPSAPGGQPAKTPAGKGGGKP